MKSEAVAADGRCAVHSIPSSFPALALLRTKQADYTKQAQR